MGMSSIFKNIAGKVADKAAEKLEEALDSVGGALKGGKGGSTKSCYGINAQISLKIDGKEIKNEKFSITDVMIETSTSNEAGVCEIRMQSIVAGLGDELPLKKNDISNIKVGHSLEVLIASSNGDKFSDESTVFKGFVENLNISFEDRIVTCVINGMDAKMWMMANKFTGERGNNVGYKKIVKNVLGNYSKQANIGKIKLTSDPKLKGRCYQFGKSDYEFLCDIADMTGSLFFIDKEGSVNFCSLESFVSGTEKIEFKDNNVCKLSLKISVWGTVQSVTVVATDSSNSHKTIKATSKSAKSVGSGKGSDGMVSKNYSSLTSGVRCIKIYDDSIKSKTEAQSLADAVYAQREKGLVEVEVVLNGNPMFSVGQGAELKGFGDPVDNKYAVLGVKHLCGLYSPDGQYHTVLLLGGNRSNL